jgi:hypothetical protein
MEFKNKPIFGMIHLSQDETTGDVINRALEEMQILEEEGVDGVIIENYHGSVEEVKTVFSELKDFFATTKLLIGINILPNEFEVALKLANEVGAQFIQLDYVSGTYKSGSFPMFVPLEEYKIARAKYPHIKVLGGVWPKYYTPVNTSLLSNDVKAGVVLSDAVVVTGAGTGKETPLDKIKEFRRLCETHPLIIGAGLGSSNVKEQLTIADGAIVGSCFKPAGKTTKKIKRELVKEFMDKVKEVREENQSKLLIKKSAQVVLINSEGLILGVSRKDNHNDFGLPGGKVDPEDKDEMAAAIRELKEETGLDVYDLQLVFAMHKNHYMGFTYLAKYSGEINHSEPHVVKWVPFAEITRGSFGKFNAILGESLDDMGVKYKKEPITEFKIFDEVVHPEIYYGNEVFVVVGMRADELELQGDWSGGTHNVSGRSWFKKEGMILKNRPKR